MPPKKAPPKGKKDGGDGGVALDADMEAAMYKYTCQSLQLQLGSCLNLKTNFKDHF